MKFDTTKKGAILGIFLLGMSVSLSIAMIVLSIIGGDGVYMASQIVTIIGAIFFGTGSVIIFLNSSKAAEAPVDQATSDFVRLLFLVSLGFLVIGVLFTQL